MAKHDIADTIKNSSKGVKENVNQFISLTTFIATVSGMIMAIRFGNKSANKMNSDVITKN